ncbi:MAG: ATP-binding cassette domain-containing protein, partial [Chloroflexi bacterium]|nr:ATP-binding cassette domain-containing protein [Chloroflexota bacterium]
RASPATGARPSPASQPGPTPAGPDAARTVFGAQAEAFLQAEPDQPEAWLVVELPGQSARSFLLSQPELTLGGGPEDALFIPGLPPRFARLVRTSQGYRWETLASSPQPQFADGHPAPRAFALRPGLEVHIPLEPGQTVRIHVHRPEPVLGAPEREILFQDRDRITIGRAADNDVVLDSPIVSRYHAVVERIGRRYRIRDRNTPNGTYVNGRRVRVAWLQPGDQVRIGPYRFIVGGRGLAQFAETQGVWLAAVGLTQRVRGGDVLLHDISLVIEPRELVAIVGQSGSGKTTLLNALSGYRPASEGEVIVNGVSLYRQFDAVRHLIGYVPQQDIIHRELTVWEALDYAAQLRLPPDMTREERHQRIEQVLQDLDLAHRRDVPIHRLSGGQQKRVSIGVELLTRPGLFFLDEPTSGLDPGTETLFMRLLRRLADQGCTIVLVTHTTKNVDLADKVVFLARGGYLAWFGPPDEALAYFDAYRTERERAAGPITFDDIYILLEDSSRGTPEEWAQRYRASEAYRRYVLEPLARKRQLPLLDADARESLVVTLSGGRPRGRPRPRVRVRRGGWRMGLRQTRILLSRNLRVLLRDRFSLALMLLVAPLVASLDFLLAALLGRAPFDFYQGRFSTVMVTLFSLAIYAVMVGGLSQMREIVKEQAIYRRERLVNLQILPYVLSKVGLAGLMALYQAAWYTGLHYLAFEMPGGWTEAGLIYATLALTTLGGMMLGLFSSALAPNANAAPLIVILFMVPQIVLSGVQVPLPREVSALSNTRWSFEALMSITGVGSDLMADPCWQLPLSTRALMTVEDKTALCRCMGLNLVQPDRCQFPGLGKYALPELFAPPPVEPIPPGDPPPEPELPPPPVAPQNETDPVAMARYLNALDEYQKRVEALQEAYKAQLAIYQSRVDLYSAQMVAYQQAYLRWQLERELALGPAEGMLAHVLDDYQWTFVNKERDDLFRRKVLLTWQGQAVIIAVLFGAILLVQNLKDHWRG